MEDGVAFGSKSETEIWIGVSWWYNHDYMYKNDEDLAIEKNEFDLCDEDSEVIGGLCK